MIAVLSFLGFTLAVACCAWLATRGGTTKTADDYFLAGRGLTGWVIAGSLMLTNLSTEHLIGLNGDAFNHTIAVMAWETTAAIAMVVAALYFVPKYLRIGLTTIPEFLARRFDNTTRTLATCLFLFSYAFAILPVVLLFGAAGLESLFDMSTQLRVSTDTARWFAVIGIGTLGSAYAVLGGLKAVAISDTANGVGFLIAGLLIPILALSAVGSGNILDGLTIVYAENPEKFDITGDEPGSFLPLGVLFTGMIVNQIFFWCTNQSIIQRALGAKSLAEAQKGILLAALFKLIAPIAIVIPGVIAFHMFKESIGPDDYLLAYPTLVKTVLPAWLTGLFAAVMVGAVLSTFNSVLNSAATLFNDGIYKAHFRRDASDRQQVFVGRAFSTALGGAAILAAPLIDTSGSLYQMLQQINATFFGPMLAVILAGFLSTKVTSTAAKTGLIIGPVLFYLLNFVWRDSLDQWTVQSLGLLQPIHFLHLLAVVFIATAVILVCVSWLAPEREIRAVPESGLVPATGWPHAKNASIALVVTTLIVYVLLHQ